MPAHRIADAELYYEQSGAGPDVVWLAAGDNPGSNWRRFQTPAFDDGHRSTTYDARGVGRTRSGTPPPWTIEAHAADCAALIEAACDPPVSLVGLSMGSLIAVQLAYDRPDLVAQAIVMGTCVRKTGFIREWKEAEIALRRAGVALPPAFATAHYAMQYFPAEVLGDDELWARIKPFLAADFGERDGEMLAAQWQACLDTTRARCCRRSACRSTRWRSRRTCRRRPRGSARSPSWPPTATTTCSRGSATAPRSAIAPTP